MQCSLCPNEIEGVDIDNAWTQQTVYVHGPKLNGAVLATKTGIMAHDECVERAVRGIPSDQPSLFEEL